MNILTTEHPYAPADMRWSAIDGDTYDYDAPIGWGATEQGAIDDLLGLLADDLDDDSLLDGWPEADVQITRGKGLGLAD